LRILAKKIDFPPATEFKLFSQITRKYKKIFAIVLKLFVLGAKKKPSYTTALDTLYYICVSNADALGLCSERVNIQGGA
jgi:hypothetical protein